MDEFAEEEVVENPTLRAAYNLAPLHQNQPLCWDYEVHLIGEKIYDKVIHLCETCELPILVYGRLLPCKHIFCFDCARKCDKFCKRCNGKVQKVEKSALGTVYVCTYGAPKHSTKGCRRTYLSQRDLQAHIAHRHMLKASTVATPAQPVPNQLPLTKQQAAQQASQKQVGTQDISHASPVQSHLLSSVLPVQSSLAPPLTSLPLSHQQPSGLPNNSQQMNPAPPHIPGLGDLRPIATLAQPIIGQNSPLMQPSPSPSNLSQGMNLPYSSTSQANPDIYHPMEMVQQQQQQQMQQVMGIPSSHMQPGQSHQPYPHPAQFPVSTPMMHQMNTQQLLSTAPMHPNSFTHSHPPMPGPQNLDSYNEPQNMPLATQPRTNVNLITVPIQDEGQYRPLPYINSPLPPHPNSYPQTRPMMSGHTQAYTQPQMTSSTFSTPSAFPQMASQPQIMATPNSPQGLPFNQPNTQFANSSGQMGNPRPVMTGNPHPGNPHSGNPHPGNPHPGNPHPGNPHSGNQHPGNPHPGNPHPGNPHSGNPHPGNPHPGNPHPGNPHPGNPHPGMPRGMTDVMLAMSMSAVRGQGGGGMMPSPAGVQGPVNRFPPPGGQWPGQAIIQPRMTQGQPRPHGEGQFSQGGYYH